MVKYFAYGSNMNDADLNNWCAKKGKSRIDLSHWQRCLLENHRLDFTHYSGKNRKGGVADVLYSLGDRVEGVLFDILEAELKIIAEKEGEHINIYKRMRVQVKLEDQSVIEAITFQVREPKPFIRPHLDYMKIIINGAEKHQLSKQWIERLKQIPTRNN